MQLFMNSIVLVLAAVFWMPFSAFAEIEKQLQFDSDPPGAQVYMLEGTRRISVGTTPFRHAAEFHSEQSVLRFYFERTGYASKTVEVNASQDRVSATLTRRSLGADPKEITDETARKAQEQLNPVLTSTLPGLMEPKGGWSVDIDGTALVRNSDGRLWLTIPLRLNSIPDSLKGTSADKGQELARKYWDGFGKRMLAELEAELPRTAGLSEIVVRTRIDSVSHGFAVSSHVETETEMKCQGGYDQVYQSDPCAYYVNGSCKPGNKMLPMYNPCKTRIPVTRSVVKIDPKASVAAKHERMLAVKQIGKGTPSLMYLDSAGKVLFREGNVPEIFLKSEK